MGFSFFYRAWVFFGLGGGGGGTQADFFSFAGGRDGRGGLTLGSPEAAGDGDGLTLGFGQRPVTVDPHLASETFEQLAVTSETG